MSASLITSYARLASDSIDESEFAHSVSLACVDTFDLEIETISRPMT
jgi:hypothetical protein